MPNPSTQSRPTRRRAKAFALPLVLMVVLTAGLSVALLMERHGVSYRSINRQVENYKNHHRSSGVKECVLRWLDTSRGRIAESLDDNGMAFKMNVQGEGHIDVFFRDAQGSTLTDPSALSGRRREIVEDIKFILDQVPEEFKEKNMFRPVGPPEICVNTAPDLVIHALCLAIIGDVKKAKQAAEAILDRRTLDGSDKVNVPAALADINIEEKERREIAAMLINKPALYEILAETRDSSDNLLDKSSGLYQIDDSKNDTFKQGGGFLTWDVLPVQ